MKPIDAPLVSIICAARNAEATIAEAVASAVAQHHPAWELLVGDDGSTDGTVEAAERTGDARVKTFRFAHRGVAATRNELLDRMRGAFFCFLDADDVLPPNAIADRLALLLADPQAAFADGAVELRDAGMRHVISRWSPSATGDPTPHLLALNGKCFLGNTWLVRREPLTHYAFEPGLTHGEDLLFFLTIAQGGRYVYTASTVLWYRRGTTSAMTDLDGLENGYARLYQRLCSSHLRTAWQRMRFKARITRIMVASHGKDGRSPWRALRVAFRYLFLAASSSNTPS